MSKNPFETHGIAHLSASSLNKFKAAPAAWVTSYLFKKRDATNAAMQRGNAAEGAIEWGLKRELTDLDEVAAKAHQLYDKGTPRLTGATDDVLKKWKDEREKAAGCARSGLAFLNQQNLGPLTASQQKVCYEIAGIEVPIIGYTDYEFGETGHIVDLKSVARAQNTPKRDHSLQIAGYAVAQSNMQTSLLYVWPRGKTMKADEIAARWFKIKPETVEAELCKAAWTAHAIRRVLSISSDPDEIAALFAPDFESFYYSDPKTAAFVADKFQRPYK